MVQGWKKKFKSRAPWRDLGLRWIFKDKKEWTPNKKIKNQVKQAPHLIQKKKKGLKALPPYIQQPNHPINLTSTPGSVLEVWILAPIGTSYFFSFFTLIRLSALCVVFRDERIIQPTRDHFFFFFGKEGESGILHRYISTTLATPAGAIIWFNIEQNLQFFFGCFFGGISLVFLCRSRW